MARQGQRMQTLQIRGAFGLAVTWLSPPRKPTVPQGIIGTGPTQVGCGVIGAFLRSWCLALGCWAACGQEDSCGDGRLTVPGAYEWGQGGLHECIWDPALVGDQLDTGCPQFRWSRGENLDRVENFVGSGVQVVDKQRLGQSRCILD